MTRQSALMNKVLENLNLHYQKGDIVLAKQHETWPEIVELQATIDAIWDDFGQFTAAMKKWAFLWLNILKKLRGL